jgi:hypothetical protein
MKVDSLKRWLQGTWDVQKIILDLNQKTEGTFKGTLHFKKSKEDSRILLYCEEGMLSFQDFEGPSFRSLFYTFPETYQANVYFAPSSFFHDLDLRTGQWSVLHSCGSDLYEGKFSVREENQWQVTWKIKGPRKNLIIDSTLVRIKE